MHIFIDSREKPRAITKIIAEFDRQGITYAVSKLYVADYMSLDNPRLVIDRKQNLSEVCGNVTTSHDRFRRELIRAQELGIKVIILVEDDLVESLENVIWWDNPRATRRVKGPDGRWRTITTKAMKGQTLYKILTTISQKYEVEFRFCKKKDTGKQIIEILREGESG